MPELDPSDRKRMGSMTGKMTIGMVTGKAAAGRRLHQLCKNVKTMWSSFMTCVAFDLMHALVWPEKHHWAGAPECCCIQQDKGGRGFCRLPKI